MARELVAPGDGAFRTCSTRPAPPSTKSSTRVPSRQSLAWSAVDWVAGCSMIYLALFGTGKIIFGSPLEGLLMLVAGSAWALGGLALRAGARRGRLAQR